MVVNRSLTTLNVIMEQNMANELVELILKIPVWNTNALLQPIFTFLCSQNPWFWALNAYFDHPI